MQSLGIDMPSTVASNNMVALIGMAVAGLGISYLPRQCLQPLVDNGSLVALDVKPSLPQVKYMTMHRSELHSPLISAITAMVEGCCDFSQMLQTGPAGSS